MKRKLIAKRLACFVLIFIFAANFAGCKKQKKDAAKEENVFDIKIASNLLDVYMKALIKEDYEGAKKMYSKELQKNSKDMNGNDLKIKGYSIEETSEIGKTGFFKLRVARTNLDKPAAVLDSMSIKIIKEEQNYKIDDIKNETEKEAFIENNTIRVRSKNNISTNLMIDSASLPQYVFSKDDKANMYKQIVPRTNFGVISFGYQGDKAAISAYDKDSYIGIIKIDESLATQGGGDQGGGGGQGGGGQGKSDQNKGGQGQMAREKPIGKEMVNLDLIKDAKVEFLTFSMGEKNVVVQYSKANVGKCIRVYSSDSGDLIPVKFEEKYPYGKVEIIFSSFDKEVMNYEVTAKNPSDKSLQDVVGKYQLSLKKDYKIKKL
jgi:hypothetical protein